MFFSKQRFLIFPLAVLVIASMVPGVGSGQTQDLLSVSGLDLIGMAETLKQDLEKGSVLIAHMHAVQLDLAIHGVLPRKAADNIAAIERQRNPDKESPSLTAPILPLVDRLMQALNDSDVAASQSYAQQIATQMREVQNRYIRHGLAVTKSSDPTRDSYFAIADQLFESLKAGDVAQASVLAMQLQTVIDGMSPPMHRSMMGQEIYEINDALGRAAFLRKEYQAAGDYLLKAADTPGSPVLGSFGPDMWLAQSLLIAGEKDVVLTFLERCKAFWKNPKLDQWIAALQEGKSPDLRPNIYSSQTLPSR
jgi:hypothetical protein